MTARKRWRLIRTFGASPEFNMGLDEALLEANTEPTLRVYTWKPDTLSLGYFQRLDEVPRAAQASALVRRITGGGAIHHVSELTFSLALSLEHPLYSGSVADSYRRVHAVVAKALNAFCGIDARLRGTDQLASDCDGTGMCFHQSTALDLVWGGRKGLGSAQRRKRGRVLHHGSIKLGASPLDSGVATVEAEAGAKSALDLAPFLVAAFESEWQLQLVPSVPDAAERDLARSLGARSRSKNFVERAARAPRRQGGLGLPGQDSNLE